MSPEPMNKALKYCYNNWNKFIYFRCKRIEEWNEMEFVQFIAVGYSVRYVLFHFILNSIYLIN